MREPAPVARDEVERRLTALVASGAADEAATLAIRAYGPDLHSFLIARSRAAAVADEAFADACERIWRAIGNLAPTASFRAWAYAVARNALADELVRASRRAVRERPIASGMASRLAAEVRSATTSLFRTDNVNAVVALREELAPEDQELLILRIDRDLEWAEVARALGDAGAELDEASLKREAARLRKRFQMVRQRLLELGRRRGLV